MIGNRVKMAKLPMGEVRGRAKSLLVTFRHCYPIRKTGRVRHATHVVHCATMERADGEGEDPSEEIQNSVATNFDPLLGLSLAGYAFFAYKEPKYLLRQETISNASVSFLEKDYLLQNFAGILHINLQSASLSTPNQGGKLFCTLSCGDETTDGSAVDAECEPLWNDSFQFMVKDLEKDLLQVKIWRKRFLRPDELQGASIIPVKSLVSSTDTFVTPIRGGVAEGTMSIDIDFESFGDVNETDLVKADHVIELIGMKEAPLLHLDTKACCFIANEESDTQVWMWWNREKKELIFAFRGTEQTEWKDLLTDISLVPSSLDIERTGEHSILTGGEEVMIHSGFLNAYDSVRSALFSQLGMIVSEDNDWTVYVTGHSLGGALATLFAYEIGKSSFIDADVIAYSYGSPRLGNKTFADDYNITVKSSWRLCNDMDIIPSVPRLLGYQHVDTSVAIRDDGTLSISGNKDVIGEAHFMEFIPELAMKALKSENGESTEELINQELALLSSLMDGSALAQHMEDFYLERLQKLAKSIASREI